MFEPVTLQDIIPLVNKKEKTLVIGAGEIGKSLKNVLKKAYDVVLKDREALDTNNETYRVINICYPYSDGFFNVTKKYIELYKPELTIIHSTVKPGTTKLLGRGVVHSPVNGRHPYLEESILKFVKFVGGNDISSVYEAVNYLNKADIRTQVFSNSLTTEVAKIGCTSRYGLALVEMKEFAKTCEEFGVDFTQAYTEWNNGYNEGYGKLNEFRFIRPVLFPMSGSIGGHCVVPNCDLLDNFVTQVIKSRNLTYQKGGSDDKPKSNNPRRHKNLASRVK
jgi:hypothetical protein